MRLVCAPEFSQVESGSMCERWVDVFITESDLKEGDGSQVSKYDDEFCCAHKLPRVPFPT